MLNKQYNVKKMMYEPAYLYFDNFIINDHALRCKIHSDRTLRLTIEFIVSESRKKTRFSHCWISDQHYLVKVIVEICHCFNTYKLKEGKQNKIFNLTLINPNATAAGLGSNDVRNVSICECVDAMASEMWRHSTLIPLI